TQDVGPLGIALTVDVDQVLLPSELHFTPCLEPTAVRFDDVTGDFGRRPIAYGIGRVLATRWKAAFVCGRQEFGWNDGHARKVRRGGRQPVFGSPLTGLPYSRAHPRCPQLRPSTSSHTNRPAHAAAANGRSSASRSGRAPRRCGGRSPAPLPWPC